MLETLEITEVSKKMQHVETKKKGNVFKKIVNPNVHLLDYSNELRLEAIQSL